MPSESARTIRRWPLIAGGLVASLLALYFLLTSGMFLKSFVLPKVSDAAFLRRAHLDLIGLLPTAERWQRTPGVEVKGRGCMDTWILPPG